MRLLAMLYLNMISVGEFKERLLKLIPDTIIREELQTVALQLYNSDEHDFVSIYSFVTDDQVGMSDIFSFRVRN